MQDGFADGFAGNCPGVDGGPANDFELFDQRGALAELHRLNRRALSRGTGAQDDEVVTFHGEYGAKPGKLPRKYTTVKFVVFRSLFFRQT